MLRGFSGLQNQETRAVGPLVAEAGIDWLLEMAPLASPSPKLTVPRLRMLLAADGWRWPVRAQTCPLPFPDESLPAVMLRYLIRPAVDGDLLEDVHRCLVPGGALILVAANPYHPRCWRQGGPGVIRMPGRVRLLGRLARLGFRPVVSPPPLSVSPVWALAARKEGGAARVRQVRFERTRRPPGRVLAGSTCRAA